MRIEKRLISSFCITTLITSVTAIAAILVLLIISNRYTYALQYFGFAQGDIGRAMILFTDIRGDTRAIVGYDDQSVINNLISQYDEDKEEFTLLWEGVDLRVYSLIPQQQRRHRLQVRNYRHRLQR